MDRTDYLGFRKTEIRYVKFHRNRTFWDKLFSRVLAVLEWAGGIWGFKNRESLESLMDCAVYTASVRGME